MTAPISLAPSSRFSFVTRHDLLSLVVLAAVVFLVLPLTLDIFRLNLVGKYLTYAFVAVGLVLCWGMGGILSLGQGVFFGLGGYAMAMFLKLEASSPEATAIQSTPGIPDFMDWNQLTELPAFWVPFQSFAFTLFAVVAIPVAFAAIVGFAMFTRRVGGVYFAIITQALAAIATVLVIGQQGYTGGVNGITDLRTLLGWDIRSDIARYTFYFVNATLLMGALIAALYVQRSRLGRLLTAVRTSEDRVRFSGYSVASLKVFVFCLAAGLSSIGGAMFTLQVGFMSPTLVGVVPSIEMVVYCAVGGRLSVFGAVYGTLLINWLKTLLSESFPELWLFGLGGVFIAVVMFFPNGLAGLYRSALELVTGRRGSTVSGDRDTAAGPSGDPAGDAPAGTPPPTLAPPPAARVGDAGVDPNARRSPALSIEGSGS